MMTSEDRARYDFKIESALAAVIDELKWVKRLGLEGDGREDRLGLAAKDLMAAASIRRGRGEGA